tara:strand:+ start:1942 stop:2121 length:180 start_codon:yes stop_codon:yes gene_type:complete
MAIMPTKYTPLQGLLIGKVIQYIGLHLWQNAMEKPLFINQHIVTRAVTKRPRNFTRKAG